MKYCLVVMLVILLPFYGQAQVSNLYGDMGVSLARGKVGSSVTYDRNLGKYFALGVGEQYYDFHATRSNFQYIPAMYADIRCNIRPGKAHQFFLLADLGVDLYERSYNYWRSDNEYYRVHGNNGFYYGLGFGYFHRIMKNGWGPYVCLKMISNEYRVDQYDNVNGSWNKYHGIWGDNTFVVSLGFRF